jgi:hypothetical protein
MMNDRRAPGQAQDECAGLCARCLHVQIVVTPRESRFYLCRLSLTDPAFPRYPRIPVISCAGFTLAAPDRCMR